MRDTEVPGSSARGPFGVCFKLCDFFFCGKRKYKKIGLTSTAKPGPHICHKEQLHDGTIFFVLAFTAEKRCTTVRFICTRVYHKKCCTPLQRKDNQWILSPALRTGYEAVLPRFGPFLMFSLR